MLVQNVTLNGFRKHRQTREVVVAVAFDVLDTERRHDGHVLQHGHRAEVREILGTHHSTPTINQRPVG